MGTIWVASFLFLVGALCIIKGGDLFVDAAGWVSDVSGISRVVIGATLVSFATTAPEFFVSLIAVIKGSVDLAVGNAVGSLICNLGTAFALLAICMPGPVNDRLFGMKGGLMIFSTAMLWIFCWNGVLSVVEGAVLLLIFAGFTHLNIRCSHDEEDNEPRRIADRREKIINSLKFVGGTAGILIGSNLIVDNGQIIARYLGVSEAVIGLTIVAIGTSLPELVTSIAAIAKKECAISIGNILGANVLDATLILAAGSFASGGRLSVSQAAIRLDLPVTLLLMAFAVFPTLIGKKLYRWQGVLILGTYLSYLVYIIALA